MPPSKQKFRDWLFGLGRWKKRLLQFTFDSFLAPLALLLAFFMRLESTDYLHHPHTYIGALIVMVITPVVFAALGLYSNFTRHISIETAYSIVIGSATSCAVLLSGVLLLDLEIPRSVPLIFAMFFCVIDTAARFLIRALGQRMNLKQPENIAIFGLGANSIQLMEALKNNPNYRVKLFIHNDSEVHVKNLGGIPIKKPNQAKKSFEKLGIETLLLSTSDDINASRKLVFGLLSDYPLKVKTIPSITSLISGKFKNDELQDIKIEELLGREPVKHDPEIMAKTIAGKTVLVTGAGGSIGSELCRQIIHWGPRKLILLDVSEYATYTILEELKQFLPSHEIDLIPLIGSVQDRFFIKQIFDHFIIDTTYHAAAYKHVPLMEQNVIQCIANNVLGTLNVAELSAAAEVKNFILISTDKAVNPTNYMGASKRLAEIVCQDLSTNAIQTRFSIVRFGNVLGSSGSVVPLFKAQIRQGGPVTVTHKDVTRFFMTIPEAAQLVIQAGSIAKGGDVFVLDMGDPIKILDLAKRMITLMGSRPILSAGKTPKDGEISITFTGLRPGEKLYEELSYNTSLLGTSHPRINTAVEKRIKHDELQSLMAALQGAIRQFDYPKLYKTIAQITNGVSEVSRSSDSFLRRKKRQQAEMAPNTINQDE